MNELTVIARATAKIGKDEELESIWKAVMFESMKEQGCRGYTLHRSTENRMELISVERWASQRALDTHMKSAHVGRLLARVPELVDGQPEIKVYQSIE